MTNRPKKIKCPKCSEKISVPFREDEKVFIHCKSCGAKGRIKNPHLDDIKAGKGKPKSRIEDELDGIDDLLETGPDEEPESIECPKCGEDILVPFSSESEVMIKCRSCGAKGRVPNPYVDEPVRTEASAEPEIEIIECPKCESDINVPYSGDERVIVECRSCGAMGSINNPFMIRKLLESEGPEEEETPLEINHDSDHSILEQINCPRCKVSIDVPYSTDQKLKIKCDSCGAKGQISNPYL
jgi:DNA-directed RNA polymerase subunit M/transcription elongation factor TFIIS